VYTRDEIAAAASLEAKKIHAIAANVHASEPSPELLDDGTRSLRGISYR
jgi:hypothetical protein